MFLKNLMCPEEPDVPEEVPEEPDEPLVPEEPLPLEPDVVT
jgi:hypothetical protein